MAARPCNMCGAIQPSAMGFHDDSFAQVLEHDGPSQGPFIRDPEDDIVVPIPIGHFPNGYSLGDPVFEPVSGFEHLSRNADFSQHFVDSATVQREVAIAPTKPNKVEEASENDNPGHGTDTSGADVDPMRLEVMCEPASPSLTSTSPTTTNNKDKESTQAARKPKRQRRPTPESRVVRRRKVLRIPPYTSTLIPQKETFYIGDLDSVKEFFKKRLHELTLGPLRSIATEWIKLAEPDRKGVWGSYSRMKPECDSEGKYPQWWPRHIRHLEPGHLKSDELVEVCVQLLLLHRYLDNNNNPRLGWTQELKKAANYIVESIRVEKFAAGRQEYNEGMKKRASKYILPDLLKVAQTYEDHIAPFKLWKNTLHDALVPLGEQHTWTPCPKPRRGKRYTSPKWERSRKRSREDSPAATVADSDSHSERDVKLVLSRESTTEYASTACDSPMVISAPGSFEFPNPPSHPVLQSNDFQNFGTRARTQSITYVPVPVFHRLPHGLPHLSPFDVMPGQVSTMSAPTPAMPTTDLSMPYWQQMDRSQSYHSEFPTYHI